MKLVFLTAFISALCVFDIAVSVSEPRPYVDPAPYNHYPPRYYPHEAGYLPDTGFCSEQPPGNHKPPGEPCPNGYIACLPSGQGLKRDCPPSTPPLVFNGTHCDHAANVAGCEGSVPDTADPFCKNKQPGDYASGKCRYHYITCTNDLKAVDRKCPYYTVFREECNYCDYRSNVEDCHQFVPPSKPCIEAPTTPSPYYPGSYHPGSYYHPTYTPSPTTPPDVATTPPPYRPGYPYKRPGYPYKRPGYPYKRPGYPYKRPGYPYKRYPYGYRP